ncbi:PLAT/LH2 domain-containing protein [Propionivibrio soli]|uniref:PLAT/LH2 domain-containing protein n=1 Tax=Propionivibrio soli TaxID=2976531 RepID=UPI0021E75154|nr:PLAT/LH2 domain-containing protein [Propionivibrio soli]
MPSWKWIARATGLICLLLSLLGSSCQIPPASTEQILRDAVEQLSSESSNWRQILEETRDKLVSDAQSSIRNEVSVVLSRAVAAAGSEVMCVTDFIRDRAKQDLLRILDRLEGRTPSPTLPVFCQVIPQSVDAELVPNRLRLLEYYGYDFDRSPIAAYLENSNGRTNVSRYLDFPTHYHMTLNLGTQGVAIGPNSRRFVFAWDGRDQASVAITQSPPPPVRPTYFISIRTWDMEAGAAASDGKVFVTFVGSHATSDELRVPGDFRRGEVETASFVSDDLGNVSSVTIRYDDGVENNAWALDWIEIKNMTAAATWLCRANTWLGHQAPLTKNVLCARQ